MFARVLMSTLILFIYLFMYTSLTVMYYDINILNKYTVILHFRIIYITKYVPICMCICPFLILYVVDLDLHFTIYAYTQ